MSVDLTSPYLALVGARPRRFETRSTCVSTEIVGLSQMLSTTSAVFGPTLGNSCRLSRTCSNEPFSAAAKLPEYFSLTTLASCFKALAFCLCKPATWIAFSIVRTRALLKVDTETPTAWSKFPYARSAATSVQFCERIVTTRTRKGSPDSLATREAAKSSSWRGMFSRSTFRMCWARFLSATTVFSTLMFFTLTRLRSGLFSSHKLVLKSLRL